MKFKTTGTGGSSGKCYTKTVTVTPGTSCNVVVDTNGAETYLQCNGVKYSSNSGTANAASGATGGAGFTNTCSKDTSSSAYGKGGNGTTSGTTAGNAGLVYIKNAT